MLAVAVNYVGDATVGPTAATLALLSDLVNVINSTNFGTDLCMGIRSVKGRKRPFLTLCRALPAYIAGDTFVSHDDQFMGTMMINSVAVRRR